MKYLAAAIALTAFIGSPAFAGDDAGCDWKTKHQKEQTNNAIPVKPYQYGMKIDVAEVVWMSDHTGQERLVRSQMIYRDPQGEVHHIEYIKDLGMRNQNG